jgi:hypothetical protein
MTPNKQKTFLYEKSVDFIQILSTFFLKLEGHIIPGLNLSGEDVFIKIKFGDIFYRQKKPYPTS